MTSDYRSQRNDDVPSCVTASFVCLLCFCFGRCCFLRCWGVCTHRAFRYCFYLTFGFCFSLFSYYFFIKHLKTLKFVLNTQTVFELLFYIFLFFFCSGICHSDCTLTETSFHRKSPHTETLQFAVVWGTYSNWTTTLTVWSPRAHLHVVGMLWFMSDINQPSLPTPLHSVLVSLSVSMALSTVFHFINSLDNSPVSHSVLPVLSLSYWSFQLCIFMKVSFSPNIISSGWLGSKHQL